MTFREAHLQWSNIDRNHILAIKTRYAVNKVLMEKCGDMDVTLINKSFITLLMKDCKEDQSYKVNATSVLCHVLTWLHRKDPSLYQMPDFTYHIASVSSDVARNQAIAYLAMAGSKYKKATVMSNYKSPLAWRQATDSIVNNFNL